MVSVLHQKSPLLQNFISLHSKIFILDVADVLRDFQCNLCSKLLGSRAALQRHAKEVHSRNSTVVSCPRCQKLFQNRSNLKIHMLTHSGVRPFKYVHTHTFIHILWRVQYIVSVVLLKDVRNRNVMPHLPPNSVCNSTTKRCTIIRRNKCRKLNAVSLTHLMLIRVAWKLIS